ncbi:MAG: glycosyltransferase [Bacilli bacterium]|nr:glycosyltransferase [Bacilli bacterium]
MKVLVVFNHPAPYKVHIFNELAKYVDLTVLFERNKAKDRPDEFYNANEYKFNCIILKDGYIGNEGSLSSGVKNYIKEHHQKYDQIVMNGYSHLAELKAIKYMHKHNIPFSLLINGGIPKEKEFFLKKNFKSSYISKADYYMSPSQKSDDYLIFYGANKEKIYRYPYSNLSLKDMKYEEVDKNASRDKYGLPKGKRIYINACQFIERKNNIQLMSLFKGREEVLVLVGDGPLKSKYEGFIGENEMKNVYILPFMKKEELFNLYKACDYFITLAKADIFGHTTLEGLANGLPVISSNKVMSSLEYIKNGVNGYIVDLDNEEEILSAIDNVKKLSSKDAFESAKNNTFEACGKRLYEIMSIKEKEK